MNQYSLAFRQTGWLYLLLILWGLCYWALNQGIFNTVNQLNREGLYKTLPMQQAADKVLRVESALNDQASAQVSQLLLRFPTTPVVILGNPSKFFMTELQTLVLQHAQLNSVIVATGASSSSKPLTPVGYIGQLSEWRLPAAETVKWRTSQKLLYAPLVRDAQSSFPLFWLHQQKAYLSLLGEAFHQVTIQNSTTLDIAWDINWHSGKQVFPLGISSQIFSAGELPKSVGIDAFLTGAVKDLATPQLIIIDDNSYPHATDLSRSLERLLQQDYLHRGIWVALLEYGLLLLGLATIWFARRLSVTYQVAAITVYSLLLLLCQYISFSQLQWLAIIPWLVVVLFSWLILLGYQRENAILQRLKTNHNQLLSEVLPVYYHAQKLEKIQPFLAQTSADITLANKVFDVALEAEAKHNSALAKKLYEWIQHSGIKHQDSAKRLAQINQQTATESLDQTLVIDAKSGVAGQSNPSLAMNNALAIEYFGRYKVEGVLGKGAMGIVFQGVDPKINRHVAIKTLQLNQESSEDALAETKARFFREAETAGNLSHANIVTIYDVGEEGDLGYIAMDLLTGAPLSEYIKPQHKLPAPLVYQLMIQITDALDYAHRQHVVHRDIKPANIIYDDEIQRVTLTDFGIAYVTDQSKTRTGTIMGSPYYMSPEQVLGRRVDGRSDIFSLGVTLYQLLSGYLPFEGESIASVAYHITTSKHSAVRQKDSRLPASASRITNKAMQKDADKRYQTAGEFKQALISALKRDFKKDPLI